GSQKVGDFVKQGLWLCNRHTVDAFRHCCFIIVRCGDEAYVLCIKMSECIRTPVACLTAHTYNGLVSQSGAEKLAMSSSVVDEIKSRLDIVQYIQRYTPLRKAGRTYKCNCVFHSEKTPSMVVDPGRQTFKCFGCGKGGDVIRFAMDKNG